MRAADELIDCIVNGSQIPSARGRSEIQRELRCHVEDVVMAAREAGRDEQEIEKLVLTRFGDPYQIARDFERVYRHERRRLQAYTYAISTVLLAGSLLAGIVAVQAGLAFGLGTPIMKVLAGRHTVMEALDILATVAAYMGITLLERVFKSLRFQKAALLLAAILTVPIVLCVAASLHTNFLVYGLVAGVFFRSVQLYVTSTISRVSIVGVIFPVVGLVIALLRSPVSPVALAATCASWFAMGGGYLLMTHLAARVDRALLNGLERI